MSRDTVLADAVNQVEMAAGLDRGDELRRQAEVLAYRSAMGHVRELRRIENALANAAQPGRKSSGQVRDYTLDIIRTHMCRGLIRAQQETGDHPDYWRRR